MDERISGEVHRSTSTSTSSSSSRHSSTVRRSSSKQKVSATVASSTLRARPSGLEERSLTSFPSLSPESSPQVERSTQHAEPPSNPRESPETPRQPRMNLVETLMSTSSHSVKKREALFADSPATTAQDVPGALHHASDDHIQRVAAKKGVVALVRQLASDLAQREAEMTTLRLRAEARERELKKMLREVEVSNLDIERRLHKIEVQEDGSIAKSDRNSIQSVGDLVGEALGDTVDSMDQESFLIGEAEGDRQGTIRASARARDTTLLSSSAESGKRQSWMGYLLGSSGTVRKHSAVNPSGDDFSHLANTTTVTGRRAGMDETLFQPPKQADDVDAEPMTRITSNKSEKASRRTSRNSWTMKLFAGNPSSTPKENDLQVSTRGRSSTTASDTTRSLRANSQGSKQTTETGASATSGKSARHAPRRSINGLAINLPGRNDARSINSLSLASPASVDHPENLGPVEMDAILPHGSRPPTLTPSYEGAEPHSDILTDRFGFIYDQRRRKKEAEALAKVKSDGPTRAKEISSNLHDLPDSSDAESLAPPVTPRSADHAGEEEEASADGTSAASRGWQDYLKIATFPTELLSQTPGPATTTVVESAKPSEKKTLRRVPTFGDNGERVSPNPVPSASTVVSGKAEIAKPVLSSPNSPLLQSNNNQETEPVKLLLAQLTELHDKLQREKTVRWNEFLRKVRAERRRHGETSSTSAMVNESRGKKIVDLPEAHIADGEIIGISSLGHKGKLGRAKYREFRALVLGGIPVAHRAKIWSECSGANALRVPGYYQELVEGQVDADPSVVMQIEMDINRTLTDNVFFRSGPGVAKLSEVLLAYARRNPEVGYCQGMNMIAASLLLIMPTAEDAFWILASLVENILPQHYYDNSLLASRADQQVLRSYVTELLPRLDGHLEELSVELEALTFQWFLSLFTDCLSAEALYRVWDVLLCCKDEDGNGGSTFLFQVALALLKLNENQLLGCETPGEVYTYLGGEITNHAISIDGLIRASEGLKTLVKRREVEERRKKWVKVEEETIRERERIRNGGAAAA